MQYSAIWARAQIQIKFASFFKNKSGKKKVNGGLSLLRTPLPYIIDRFLEQIEDQHCEKSIEEDEGSFHE